MTKEAETIKDLKGFSDEMKGIDSEDFEKMTNMYKDSLGILRLNIDDIQEEMHNIADDKDWWKEDDPRTYGDLVALMHTELSESLEEHRKDNPALWLNEEKGKPEGWAVELADCVIRIMDFLGKTDIRLSKLIALKTGYNKTRESRHGGKKI